MSNKFTTQQIQDRFASLPADMQRVISSSDTASLIQDIGAQHKLRIDAIGILIEYSGLIMLGLIQSNEFVDSLVRETGVTREQAANLALDVDTQVFSQVRKSLRQAQYRSTADTRFEQGNDFAKTEPVAAPEPIVDLPSTPITDKPLPADIPMASTNYNPDTFATAPASSSPEPASMQPVSTTGPSALDQAAERLESAFETPAPVREDPVVVELNRNSGAELAPGYDSAATDQEVSRSMAAETIKGMPAAVQDAYKAGQASAPAPQATPAAIKDFQTILEEKMTQQDTSSFNNDPYKESL